MDRSFYLENFGCRATQADGAAIERQLLDKGLARAEDSADADVVVLNTCTVTSSADQDARATIRRIHRENPGATILVTGCYAQRAPEEIAQIPGVSVVVGNSHKGQLADIAGRQGFVSLQSVGSAAGEIVVGDIFAHTELMAAPVFDADTASEKTRPNLKVQDGCNNRCSFCIIPYVRGKSRSLRLDEVIRETRALVELKYKEIVLSGINLGRWGRDLEGHSRFADLLRSMLGETDVEKIRISSVEPMDWSDDLIELVASSPRICKHAHVPLQSGSDRILRKMHRKYRPWHYADRIQKIRAAMPTAAIGADVMVGFPGETDADFEETRAFIESLPFTYLHVFTYSSRPGTPSAAMPNQVRGDVTRERNRILRELAVRKKREFQEQFIGRELQAITLTNFENGRTEALTDNYQKTWIEGRHESNQSKIICINGIEGEAFVGNILF
ncbi:MAG: tRNA (N(6)-L-threonylcarbamoyladenosine(37)-C(2))-methylthiotransferase MtaB [Terriglobia bacterium]|nr:tRNA (N(6)-L-threonylcarbamoyladenosine(37)-C(2))-methylthiotransferase MtaB [Terriglobia bacterium]